MPATIGLSVRVPEVSRQESAIDTIKKVPAIFFASVRKYAPTAAFITLGILGGVLAVWAAPQLLALAATTKIGASIVSALYSVGSTLAAYTPAWLGSFVGYVAHLANAYVNNFVLLLGQAVLSVARLSSVGYAGTFLTGAAINLIGLFTTSALGIAVANTFKAVVPNLARSLANTVKNTFNRTKDAVVERWNRKDTDHADEVAALKKRVTDAEAERDTAIANADAQKVVAAEADAAAAKAAVAAATQRVTDAEAAAAAAEAKVGHAERRATAAEGQRDAAVAARDAAVAARDAAVAAAKAAVAAATQRVTAAEAAAEERGFEAGHATTTKVTKTLFMYKNYEDYVAAKRTADADSLSPSPNPATTHAAMQP